MKKSLLRLIILLPFSLVLSACSLPFGQKAGLQIASTPSTNVIVNGQNVGRTPIYQENNKPGEYTIQITAPDANSKSWEGKVTLQEGTVTIIERQFGNTPDQSQTHILSFEKLKDPKATEVSIVSTPSTTAIAVDGKPEGFTPRNIEGISPGSHTFTLSALGYKQKDIRATVYAGFRLVINAEMATEPVIPTPTPTPEATPSGSLTKVTPTITPTVTPTKQSSSSAALTAKPYVEILDSPTGWVRVRDDGSLNGVELAKVYPGDRFAYKEASTSGWLNIEYVKGKWGFVSSQYGKVVK